MTSEELLEKVVTACDDKRAQDIIQFNVKGDSSITDYYVICHGTSDRQIQTICDEVVGMAEENNIQVTVEGYKEAKWILVDVNEVVVHIFLKPERDYYNLERLFKNGEYVEFS